jgi:spermidine/putrescine-binding protein
MLGHPRDRRRPLSRREFLRRASMAGMATPGLAALLAACSSKTPSQAGSPSAALQLARPDAPVTLPTQDNPAIADGLQPESGPLKILGYNDYIRKFVLNKFSDQYGTSVDWTIFDTPEQMVQMMQSSGSNWDLIVSVTLENVGKLGFGHLIQPLN